jgi:hypothetical protein
MIQTVNLHDFRQAFHDCGRGEQFSYEALGLIFEYYEQYEDDTGEQVNLDVIAICCDLAELTPADFRKQYDVPADTSVMDYLCDQAAYVGETDQTVIFVQF